jgi:hypothetical protein
MSMKKKSPGVRWITGKQRAELQKMNRWLTSILAANNAQPVNARPMTAQQVIDFATVGVDVAAMLLLKS